MDWEKLGLAGLGDRVKTAGMNELKEDAEAIKRRWDDEEEARRLAEEEAMNFQSKLSDDSYGNQVDDEWLEELRAERARANEAEAKLQGPIDLKDHYGLGEKIEEGEPGGSEPGCESTDSDQLGCDNLVMDQRALFVGKGAEKYIPIFDNLEQKKPGGWNWMGFLFGTAWLVYRKMYLEAIIIMAIIMAAQALLFLALVHITTAFDTLASNTLSLAFAALLGGTSYRLYWWRNNRLMEKLKRLQEKAELSQSEEDRNKVEKFIRRNSGVSMMAVFLLIVLVTLAIIASLLTLL
ncbi:MAG: DUF2628 domain-containing protein [Bacillota bacterium]|nr:DUF2628 domain-containing protein [Bacillota bacterium]